MIPILKNRVGRPRKSFGELSERSKRRFTETVRRSLDIDVLTHATQVKLKTSGKRDAAQILKDMMRSPTRATKYEKSFSTRQQTDTKVTRMSPLEALALFVEVGLSRNQYEVIRNASRKVYPCYIILQRAKLDCDPDKEYLNVTETCVEVNIQELLNLTIRRLLIYYIDITFEFDTSFQGNSRNSVKWA